MALPPSLRTSITPPELELVASEQLVEIIPLVSMERTAFISGAYGPLRPPTKAKVPLWMASNLKLKKKCHLVPPAWLDVGTLYLACSDFLQEKLTQEMTSPSFSEMPFRFAEIAKILLDVASDDLQNPERLRTLLKDIREARQAKSREGLSKLDHNELLLHNLCAMEINEIRPFFIRGMGVLTQLARQPADDSMMDQTM